MVLAHRGEPLYQVRKAITHPEIGAIELPTAFMGVVPRLACPANISAVGATFVWT
jgi:hypothetical protein